MVDAKGRGRVAVTTTSRPQSFRAVLYFCTLTEASIVLYKITEIGSTASGESISQNFKNTYPPSIYSFPLVQNQM